MSIEKELDQLRNTIQHSTLMQSDVWRKKRKGAWDQLWSSFDNVQDAQAAIDEFTETKIGKLGIYGVFQAMVVQQDAVMHIEEALGITITQLDSMPEINEVRIVRDETTGHPTGTRRNGDKSSYKGGTISYTSISLSTTKSKVLEYAIWSKNGTVFKKIDLEEAIRKQEDALSKVISSATVRVQSMEEEHNKKFKTESVWAMLSQTDYDIQKLWPHEKHRQHSKVMLEMLDETYKQFKVAIKARYGHDIFQDSVGRPGLIYIVEKIDKLFPRVKKMILLQAGVDELDLEVYVETLDNAFTELQKIAEEIDEEFGYKREKSSGPIVSDIIP